jgi:hypothetical protein
VVAGHEGGRSSEPGLGREGPVTLRSLKEGGWRKEEGWERNEEGGGLERIGLLLAGGELKEELGEGTE